MKWLCSMLRSVKRPRVKASPSNYTPASNKLRASFNPLSAPYAGANAQCSGPRASVWSASGLPALFFLRRGPRAALPNLPRLPRLTADHAAATGQSQRDCVLQPSNGVNPDALSHTSPIRSPIRGGMFNDLVIL